MSDEERQEVEAGMGDVVDSFDPCTINWEQYTDEGEDDRADWNPDQPRDQNGRFASAAVASSGKAAGEASERAREYNSASPRIAAKAHREAVDVHKKAIEERQKAMGRKGISASAKANHQQMIDLHKQAIKFHEKAASKHEKAAGGEKPKAAPKPAEPEKAAAPTPAKPTAKRPVTHSHIEASLVPGEHPDRYNPQHAERIANALLEESKKSPIAALNRAVRESENDRHVLRQVELHVGNAADKSNDKMHHELTSWLHVHVNQLNTAARGLPQDSSDAANKAISEKELMRKSARDSAWETVHRFDLASGKIGERRATPQGGVEVHANMTRVGVFKYRQPDGSIRRELRSPDEVFDPDSLATLAHAPRTIDHPDKVTPSNWKRVSIGHVAGEPVQEGKFVAGHIRIQDAHGIELADAGKLRELSCGYECKLDPTSGEYEGEPYDAIQRNIRYNHVAAGPEGWGRAGSEVRMHLDSGTSVSVDADAPRNKTDKEILAERFARKRETLARALSAKS
jgi:Uncharacterized protein conserved in bacteria (DUF2213)